MDNVWSKAFQVLIRVVFLFAYGAFLWASIHHVATFFHNFEPAGTDWSGSYALAISIDATAVVLTVGVMFFRKNMPWYAQCFVWFFIISLTAFSWLVNWEYAQKYQSNELTTDPFWLMVNPVLASSFAFLNLAYSLVAEFFNTRTETVDEMQKKLNALEEREKIQQKLNEYRERNKKPSFIQRAKSTALEVKEAANEVLKSDDKGTVTESQQGQNVEEGEEDLTVKSPSQDVPDIAPVSVDEEPLEEMLDESEGDYQELPQPLTDERQTDELAIPSKGNLTNAQTEEEREAQTETQEPVSVGVLAPVQGNTSAPLTLRHREEIEGISGADQGRNTDPEMEAINVSNFPAEGNIDIMKRRKPLTVKEAAEVLRCTEKTVRSLRTKGDLEAPESDPKMVTAASVRSVWQKRNRTA